MRSIFFMMLLLLGRSDKGMLAFELQCENYTIAIMPTSSPNLKLAHELAEFLGEKSSTCFLQTVRWNRVSK